MVAVAAAFPLAAGVLASGSPTNWFQSVVGYIGSHFFHIFFNIKLGGSGWIFLHLLICHLNLRFQAGGQRSNRGGAGHQKTLVVLPSVRWVRWLREQVAVLRGAGSAGDVRQDLEGEPG